MHLLCYPIFLRNQVFPMKYIFIASWNFWFNYLVSRTYQLWKRSAVKYKNNTARMKELFLKVWYPAFDIRLGAILTISNEKDNKHAGVSLNWLLAIILLNQCHLGLFWSNINLASFHILVERTKIDMDHYESSLFQTIATYLLEVYSRSLQESYFNCWTWTPKMVKFVLF